MAVAGMGNEAMCSTFNVTTYIFTMRAYILAING